MSGASCRYSVTGRYKQLNGQLEAESCPGRRGSTCKRANLELVFLGHFRLFWQVKQHPPFAFHSTGLLPEAPCSKETIFQTEMTYPQWRGRFKTTSREDQEIHTENSLEGSYGKLNWTHTLEHLSPAIFQEHLNLHFRNAAETAQ